MNFQLKRQKTQIRNTSNRFPTVSGGVLIFDGFQTNHNRRPCHRCRVENNGERVAAIHVSTGTPGEPARTSWWCEPCVNAVYKFPALDLFRDQEDTMTPPAVEALVGISAQTVRDMVDQRIIRGVKTAGGHYKVDTYDLAAWVDANPQKVDAVIPA